MTCVLTWPDEHWLYDITFNFTVLYLYVYIRVDMVWLSEVCVKPKPKSIYLFIYLFFAVQFSAILKQKMKWNQAIWL